MSQSKKHLFVSTAFNKDLFSFYIRTAVISLLSKGHIKSRQHFSIVLIFTAKIPWFSKIGPVMSTRDSSQMYQWRCDQRWRKVPEEMASKRGSETVPFSILQRWKEHEVTISALKTADRLYESLQLLLRISSSRRPAPPYPAPTPTPTPTQLTIPCPPHIHPSSDPLLKIPLLDWRQVPWLMRGQEKQ